MNAPRYSIFWSIEFGSAVLTSLLCLVNFVVRRDALFHDASRIMMELVFISLSIVFGAKAYSMWSGTFQQHQIFYTAVEVLRLPCFVFVAYEAWSADQRRRKRVQQRLSGIAPR